MNVNPYLDRMLPPGASERAIREFYLTMYPVMPPDQQAYAKLVLLSLKNLPADVRGALQ